MRILPDYFHEIAGKPVLVRCNFDVPILNRQVQDTTRIEDCAETLRVLLEHGCKLILLAHYDRPQGRPEADKSLQPVVTILETLLGENVSLNNNLDSNTVQSLATRIVLLENLRFWPGEEANEAGFTKSLAQLGQFYVNEAFANSRRQHASIVSLPKLLPAAAGLHLEREVKILSQVRNQPQHPLVVVIGGAKLETKEPLVSAFLPRADAILVGGKVALDLRQRGYTAPNLILAELDNSQQDITETSAKLFAQKILQAKTVIWNGTMGIFEDPTHRLGTQIVAESIDQTFAFTVVGGGDTETALSMLDLEHSIDHLGSGGGAMLEFLVNGTLPGIDALK